MTSTDELFVAPAAPPAPKPLSDFELFQKTLTAAQELRETCDPNNFSDHTDKITDVKMGIKDVLHRYSQYRANPGLSVTASAFCEKVAPFTDQLREMLQKSTDAEVSRSLQSASPMMVYIMAAYFAQLPPLEQPDPQPRGVAPPAAPDGRRAPS